MRPSRCVPANWMRAPYWSDQFAGSGGPISTRVARPALRSVATGAARHGVTGRTLRWSATAEASGPVVGAGVGHHPEPLHAAGFRFQALQGGSLVEERRVGVPRLPVRAAAPGP